MDNFFSAFCNIVIASLVASVLSVAAVGQSDAFGPAVSAEAGDVVAMPRFDVAQFRAGTFDDDASSSGSAAVERSEQRGGIVSRSVKRTLEDQKGLYLAPFKPSNFKWDFLVLGGTAGFLIADRHIENALPGGDHMFYQTSSDIAIGGLGATLGGIWIYGLKGDHPRAKELGNLELETLVNGFLIYLPMQYVAGRQRPGEGNGHGDFLRHHAMNTSFPGGHALFVWSIATVAAKEYPKPWVRILAYTSALTVTAGRFLGRDHWASDMWVGTALGIGIGVNIFNAHCDPDLSPSCKPHGRGSRVLQALLP